MPPDSSATPPDASARATGTREAQLAAELVALREEQARCRLLLDVSDALRALADPAEIKAVACVLLARHAGAARVSYVEHRGGQWIFEGGCSADGVGAYDAGLADPSLHRWLERRCAEAPFVVENVDGDPRLDDAVRHALQRAGTRALVVVRAVRGGRPAGLLELHAARQRAWTPASVELLGHAVDRVAVALQRARTDAELRDSEARLQLAVRAADLGIWDLDLHSDTSPRRSLRHDQLFGYDTPQAEWGAAIAERHVLETDRPAFRAAYERARESGVLDFEVRVRWPDGSVHWIAALGRTTYDTSRRPVRMSGVVYEVTARRRAEEALRAAHATFRDLVERSPFGVYVVDGDFRLAQLSEGARRAFRNVQPLLGRDFGEVLRALWPESFATEALGHFRRVLESGEPYRAPSTMERRRDIDELESYDWKIERIVLPDGRHGVVCHFYDLSERVQWEHRLRESEARLELAAAAAAVGVYDFDVRSGRVIWDVQVRAIWGLGPDEPFTYEDFLATLHPEDRAATERATQRALAPGGDGRYAADYRILHRGDGAPRWIAANGQVFFEDGVATRIVGTVQDITARRGVEETLRAFYEVSPLMMGTVERLEDGDLLHLYDNPATSRFFGVAPGSTARRSARSFGTSEAVIGIWRRHYDEAGRRAAPVHFEYEHEVPGSATPRLLQATVAPLGALSTSVHPTYCYVAEDVTERRAAERKLATAVTELERADRRKDEFLATLSHELRNPLAPIRTAAQLLSAPRATQSQLQWAQSVIQRQVSHMAWLLDDLLDVARITQGKLVLKKERVSLTTVVDAAVESARPQVDGRSHHLLVDLPSDAPMLEADPLRLSQVISNLLTNAAKYTDAGGRIELHAAVDGAWLVIRVRDNGIGIPPEAQPRIFDMFSQVEGANGRAEGGLGIGLALVRGLVTLHDGSVGVRSEGPGRGSEFEVRLPLGRSPADASAPAADAGLPRTGRGHRVLVADDNRDAADMLALYLGMQGHEVRVAHSGRAALSLAQAFRPDVALLDIGMPELDGYQVAEALRGESWARGLRLYAITGWGQDEDRRRARAAGFDAHLTKPVDPETLLALIDAPPDSD